MGKWSQSFDAVTGCLSQVNVAGMHWMDDLYLNMVVPQTCKILSTNIRSKTVIVAIKYGNPLTESFFFSFSDPLDPALRFLQLAL